MKRDTYYARQVKESAQFDVIRKHMSAYHLKEIIKGQYGEISKIREELEELEDAEEQQNKIMILCELADIIGAIDGYLEKHMKDFKLSDLEAMAMLTKKAFQAGDR